MNTRLLKKIRKRFNYSFDRIKYSWSIIDKRKREHTVLYTMKDAIFVMAKHYVSVKKLYRRLYDQF